MKKVQGVGASTIATVKYDEVFGGLLHSNIIFQDLTLASGEYPTKGQTAKESNDYSSDAIARAKEATRATITGEEGASSR